MAIKTKKAGKTAVETRALRKLEGTFSEWRYGEPPSSRAWIGMVALSLGALALGAGAYAMLFRSAELEPVPYLPVVWAVGIGLVAVYFLFGRGGGEATRVGELGVAHDGDDKSARIGWWQIESVTLEHEALYLKSAVKPLTLPLSSHRAAAARIVAEAMKRIPKRVELDEQDLARIGEPSADDGEKLEVEPPQITGLSCRATEEPLLVEKDARLCARCGALYHKKGVPQRCLECGKKLKS